MNAETDFIAYQTQGGEWRAYVKGNPNMQAWGFSKENAIKRLWDVIESDSKKVYHTQGGGLVEWDELNHRYVFVESPENFPNLHVGDFMPDEWGIV